MLSLLLPDHSWLTLLALDHTEIARTKPSQEPVHRIATYEFISVHQIHLGLSNQLLVI